MEKFSKRTRQLADYKSQILSSFANRCLTCKRSTTCRGADRKSEFEALTWNQIRKRSHLSRAATSKHLQVLWKEGRVRIEGRVEDNRFVYYFFLTDPEMGTAVELQEETGEEDIIEAGRDVQGDQNAAIYAAHSFVSRRQKKEAKGTKKAVSRRTGPPRFFRGKDPSSPQ